MTNPSLRVRREALLLHVLASHGAISPGTLEQALQVSRATVNRALRELVASGFLDKHGNGRSTRYVASDTARAALATSTLSEAKPTRSVAFPWSSSTFSLVQALHAPMGTRTPAGYDRTFVSNYIPNQSSLLPAQLATELYTPRAGYDAALDRRWPAQVIGPSTPSIRLPTCAAATLRYNIH